MNAATKFILATGLLLATAHASTAWYTNDPDAATFQLQSATDFQGFADLVAAGNDFAGKTIVLTSDITVPILPAIGSYVGVGGEGTTSPFKGTFDGGSKTIAIARGELYGKQYAGLFGYVGPDGQIKNVRLVATKIKGAVYVGALVGYYASTKPIENCNVTADSVIAEVTVYTHTPSYFDQSSYAGGLVGYASTAIAISNSRVSANVLATGNANNLTPEYDGQNYRYYAGGLVGYVNAPGSSISRSFSNKSVKAAASIINADKAPSTANVFTYAGGLLGYSMGGNISISRSYSGSNVNANAPSTSLSLITNTDNHAGGFAGHISGENGIGNGSITVENSYTHGIINATGIISSQGGRTVNSRAYAGGFAGIANLHITNGYTATATNASNLGGASGEFTGIFTTAAGSSSGGTYNTNLRKKSSFPDWDFNSIWDIVDGHTEPFLRDFFNSEDVPWYPESGNFYDASLTTLYISTPEHINEFSDLVAGGNDFAGKTIIQTNDINLTWLPSIGTESKPFKGTFSGGFNKITFAFGDNSASNQYVGLFGYIGSGGRIRNVRLVSDGKIKGARYVGGLVGYYASTQPIEGCSVTADSIISEATTWSMGWPRYDAYAGGLVGYASSAITISTSSVSTNVFATATPSSSFNINDEQYEYNTYAGGLIGYASGVTISHSYTDKNVTATAGVLPFNFDVKALSNTYAGGLIGYSGFNTINYSYTTGTITAGGVRSQTMTYITLTRKAYAGGFIGYGGASISYGYTTAALVAEASLSTSSTSTDKYLGIFLGGYASTAGLSATSVYYNYRPFNSSTTVISGTGGPSVSGFASLSNMQSKDGFAGWDFNNVWDIVEGRCSPFLRVLLRPEIYLANGDFQAELIFDQIYAGAQITPDPKIKLASGVLLTKGTDYDFSYGANRNVGTGSITLTGKGSQAALSGSITFNIIPKNLAISNGVASDKVYDGSTTAEVIGVLHGVEADDDVSIGTGEFANKDAGSSKAVSNVTLTGTAAGNYNLSQPSGLTASIAKKPVTISLNPKIIMLGRSEQMPDFTNMLTYTGLVTGELPSLITGTTTVSGSGYTHGSSPAGDYPITLSGTRSATNYDLVYDNTDLKFGIRDYGSLTDSRNSKTYRTITVNGKTWMAANLNLDEDGSRCYADNTGANNAACDRDGRLYGWEIAQSVCPDGWHLPSLAEWEALVKSADPDYVSNTSNTAGTKLKAMFNWNNNGSGTDIYGFSALPGGHGVGTSWGNRNEIGYWWTNERIGTSTEYYRVVMSASANHVNTRNNAPKEYFCSVRCVKSTDLSTCAIPDVSAQPYSAEQITPEVSVVCDGKTLVENEDYTVEYGENLNVLYGGSITITGINRHNGTDLYLGSVQKTFDITPKILTVSNAEVTEKIYDAAVNAEITGAVLQGVYEKDIGNVSLTNFTGSFASANAGTDIAVVSNMALTGTAASNYSLTQPELAGNILAKTLPENAIQAIAQQTYTGSSITPNIVLKDGSKTLARNVDYTQAITDNLDVGTASVTVEGTGNYTGTLNADFAIVQKSIAENMITPVPNQPYTGSAVEPDVVIKDGSKTLVKDVDYTLSSYSKNIEDQDASVVITGKGNYSGVLTTYFKISLPKFIDSRDSKGYDIAKIGNQIWFAENLNYSASGSKCVLENQTNCDIYGRLYTWDAAKNACPSGWHWPDKDEWLTLINFAGGVNETAGKKLKAKSGWYNNGNGTDDYDFAALPGGYASPNLEYFDLGYSGSWWTSTEENWGKETRLFVAQVRYNSNGFGINYVSSENNARNSFYSVRCLYGKPNLDNLFPNLSSSSSSTPSSSSNETSSSSSPSNILSSSSNGTSSSSSSGNILSSSSRGNPSSSSNSNTPIRLPQIAASNQATQIRNGINLHTTSKAVVEVYGLKGNLVSRQNFASGVYTVSYGHLPKGVYIVKTTFGSEKQILRLPVR
jgi:uncharacterized protein (TIGR02145 family)